MTDNSNVSLINVNILIGKLDRNKHKFKTHKTKNETVLKWDLSYSIISRVHRPIHKIKSFNLLETFKF